MLLTYSRLMEEPRRPLAMGEGMSCVGQGLSLDIEYWRGESDVGSENGRICHNFPQLPRTGVVHTQGLHEYLQDGCSCVGQSYVICSFLRLRKRLKIVCITLDSWSVPETTLERFQFLPTCFQSQLDATRNLCYLACAPRIVTK